MTDAPFSHTDCSDMPWLVDELVPGFAAVGEYVFVGLKDPVREPVVSDELLKVLDRVQFRSAWR